MYPWGNCFQNDGILYDPNFFFIKKIENIAEKLCLGMFTVRISLIRLSKEFETLQIQPHPNFLDIQNSRFENVQ